MRSLKPLEAAAVSGGLLVIGGEVIGNSGQSSGGKIDCAISVGESAAFGSTAADGIGASVDSIGKPRWWFDKRK